MGRSGQERLAVLVFDGVVVPALIAADESVRIARPALGKLGPSVRRSLRSPRTRAAVTLPLLALSLEVGTDSQHAQQRPERRSPARRISQWPYAAVIEKQADAYRLDPALVAAVIEQESHFDRQAYNRQSGARGLMQLTSSTASALGVTDSKALDIRSQRAVAIFASFSPVPRQYPTRPCRIQAGPTAVERAERYQRYQGTGMGNSCLRVGSTRPLHRLLGFGTALQLTRHRVSYPQWDRCGRGG